MSGDKDSPTDVVMTMPALDVIISSEPWSLKILRGLKCNISQIFYSFTVLCKIPKKGTMSMYHVDKYDVYSILSNNSHLDVSRRIHNNNKYVNKIALPKKIA